MIKNIQYIVPGQVLSLLVDVSPDQRAYWRIKCPACGEIHERESKTYWDDNPEGFGGIVHHDYFICLEKGIHFRIEPVSPYNVIMQVQFRKPATEPPVDEAGGDYIPPF